MMHEDFNAMLILYGLCGLTIAFALFALMHIRADSLQRVYKRINNTPYCCEYCDATKRVVCKIDDATVVGQVVFGDHNMLGILTDDNGFVPSSKLLPRNIAYIEAMNNGSEVAK